MVNYIPNENHNLTGKSKLYRGATRPILPTDKFSYFIAGSDNLPSSYFKKKVNSGYTRSQNSRIYRYTLDMISRPKLLRLNSASSVKYLMNKVDIKSMPETEKNAIRKAIAGSFIIRNINNRNIVFRNSNRIRDAKVADFVCKLGYDGYYTNVMRLANGGEFHEELVLCNPYDKLKKHKNIKNKLDYKAEAPSQGANPAKKGERTQTAAKVATENNFKARMERERNAIRAMMENGNLQTPTPTPPMSPNSTPSKPSPMRRSPQKSLSPSPSSLPKLNTQKKRINFNSNIEDGTPRSKVRRTQSEINFTRNLFGNGSPLPRSASVSNIKGKRPM